MDLLHSLMMRQRHARQKRPRYGRKRQLQHARRSSRYQLAIRYLDSAILRRSSLEADEAERLDLDAAATDEAEERLARTPDLDAPAAAEATDRDESDSERAETTEAL